MKTLVMSFVLLRLDYCNGLLYGVTNMVQRKAQMVQNAAVRLVSGAGRFDHITPHTHGAPLAEHRITFKIGVMAYLCVNGTAPAYFRNVCVKTSTISTRSHLRSAGSGVVMVPKSRTVLGDRRFEVAGPVVWNGLTLDLRIISSYPVFQKKLKLSCSSKRSPLRIN